MLRVLGIAFGAANQLLFLATICLLFVFLGSSRAGDEHASVGVNLLLGLQYSIVHSWLLWPATRRWITQLLSPALYGSLFSTVTCVQVWLIYAFWQADDRIVWELRGVAACAVQACFGASWLLLAYSMWLTGFGHQTGFTTWWAWVRNRKSPSREFEPRSLYRWLRHPIYFSFLGILWLTPVATADRLWLNLVWTGYIAVGSVLKDRRLAFYIGERYLSYMARVPGYPLLFWGPLGKVPLEAEASGATAVSAVLNPELTHFLGASKQPQRTSIG